MKILSVLLVTVLVAVVAFAPVYAGGVIDEGAVDYSQGELKPECVNIAIKTNGDSAIITFKTFWVYIGSFNDPVWSNYDYLIKSMCPRYSPRYVPPCQAVVMPPFSFNPYMRFINSVTPISYSLTCNINGGVETVTYENVRVVAFACNENGSGGYPLKANDWNKQNFKFIIEACDDVIVDRLNSGGVIIPTASFTCKLFFSGELIASSTVTE